MCKGSAQGLGARKLDFKISAHMVTLGPRMLGWELRADFSLWVGSGPEVRRKLLGLSCPPGWAPHHWLWIGPATNTLLPGPLQMPTGWRCFEQRAHKPFTRMPMESGHQLARSCRLMFYTGPGGQFSISHYQNRSYIRVLGDTILLRPIAQLASLLQQINRPRGS